MTRDYVVDVELRISCWSLSLASEISLLMPWGWLVGFNSIYLTKLIVGFNLETGMLCLSFELLEEGLKINLTSTVTKAVTGREINLQTST